MKAPSEAEKGAKEGAERELVLEWSRAINAREYEKLARLYGSEVVFYGKRLSKERVLDAKRKALDEDSTYRQELRDIRIERGPSGYTARFKKTWGTRGESVEARLVFGKVGTGFVLVQETDDKTDATLRVPIGEGCATAAFAAAGGHPEIRADRDRVAREMPEANPAGLVYEETKTSLDAVVGYNLPTRFDSRWWLEVKDGKLSFRNAYTMEELSFPPEVKARVEKACSGKATP